MKKVGILGGGQLGRMLLQAAANYSVEVHLMEADANCPSAAYCKHFTLGDIRRYEDVMAFGRNLDALTIEIEQVNLEALVELEKQGVAVYPKPSALRIIQNKILQKQFYQEHAIPTSAFIVTENKEELGSHATFLPAVHKLAIGGYDGRGVQLVRTTEQMELGFDAPAVLEKMVDIKQEIALMVAVSTKNEIRIYPAVEMIFDPDLNLLSHQICPAHIPEKTGWKAEAIAIQAVKKLESPGLFAVEMFVDQQDQVWVNEMAPRVHNSGHHTIEGNFSSQFDMLWRILLDYPLGNTNLRSPSAMVNLIGADGHAGEVEYAGLAKILDMEHMFVHLYGKAETRSGRKMGHVTMLGKDITDLNHQVNVVKQHIKVISKSNES
jgi:5-(carboxyamino)imidazole ribonucleotide synthase